MLRKHASKPKFRRRQRAVLSSDCSGPTFFKSKYTSKLAKPFQSLDTIIIGGKLQKIPNGVEITIAKDQQLKNMVFKAFVSALKPSKRSINSMDSTDSYQQINFVILDEYFLIKLTALPEILQIEVNGRVHELARENMSENGQFLSIGGSIAHLSQVQHHAEQPKPFPLWRSSNLVKSDSLFLSDFSKAMHPGNVVIITALPYASSNGSFAICFTQNPNPITALRLTADFNPPQSVKLMAVNNEEVEEEEQPALFPFTLNRKFRLAIEFTTDSYRLAVNGQHLATFRYRATDLPKNLNGYYLTANDDLKIITISTDHVSLESGDDLDYLKCSDLNYQCGKQ